MKALSLKQPWLQAIVEGHKTIETRTWSTRHRGLLLLCSSLRDDPNGPWERIEHGLAHRGTLARGCAIASCTLEDVRPMNRFDEEHALCRCEPGRFAWILGNVRQLAVPIPIRGKLGLFEAEIG